MNGTPPLGYPFDAIPKWVTALWEGGKLSTEARELQLALFRRANTGCLRSGQPTPKLRLDSLAVALLRPSDRKGLESLSRFLSKERQRGRVRYTVKGNAHTGYVYEFMLCLYSPQSRSEGVPTSTANADPTSTDATRRPTSGHPSNGRTRRSALVKPEVIEADPAQAATVPTATDRPKPHNEPDSDTAETTTAPTSSDVQERTNFSRTEPEKDESLKIHDARAREEADRFFAVYAEMNGKPETQEADFLSDLTAAFPGSGEVVTHCAYPSHRASLDWHGRDGRPRCRVCHPPAPGAETPHPLSVASAETYSENAT